jgi:outer membrane protein assembly factor BamE (lipoprotein component of BamABCDE complex)
MSFRAVRTFSFAAMGALAVSAAALTACAPVTKYQGYQAIDEKPASAKVGTDTKTTVRTQFGSPTTTSSFDPDIWYYITQTSDQFGGYRPHVRTRDIVAITFDKTSQTVKSVDTFNIADGRVIAFNGRETPTVGRELSVIEQLLGTVGTPLSQIPEDDPGRRPGQR